jgi:uroporphyrinogen III methyltransferase/synthase
MLHQLELLGAVPYLLPAIDIREPEDWSPVDAALDRVAAGGFDWLVFTSANGVDMFLKRLRDTGRDLRALGSIKLAAIGPSTAAKLREFHLTPDLAPSDDSRSETLSEMLRERVGGKRVLLAQALQARELLHSELEEVAAVERVTVYRQVASVDTQSAAFNHLRRGEIDCVMLTSPAIARSFLDALDQVVADRIRSGEIRLMTNGPRISAAVRERGFKVAMESKEPTAESLVTALIGMRLG